jgi:hypothetical protein
VSNQWGRNSGLTGLIDLPGQSAKFNVRIYRWTTRLNGAQRQRRGRGGGVFGTVRWVFSSGSLACTGKIAFDGWPAPDAWKGQTGTLTVQVDTGKTVAYPVLIIEAGFDFDEKKNEKANVVFACQITGAPTYSGWTSTQPAATDPSKSDLQQWEGTQFTIDPQGLQSAGTVLIDWWGAVTDSDAGDTAKLVTVLTNAVAPYTGFKKRPASIVRDAPDGGTITLTYGLTDTAEDVVNPLTQTTEDPDGIANAASVAQINSDPLTPNGFSDLGLTTREINDANELRIRQAGVRTRKEGIEQDGTATEDDLYDLADSATITQVHDSSTVPADPSPAPVGILVSRQTRQFQSTPEKWVTTWKYANLTSEQRVEFPGTEASDDPSDLGDAETVREVTDNSSFPSHSPTISGLVVRSQHSQRIGGTPEKWQHTTHYGRRTTEQDVTFPGTTTADDASDLADEKRITLVDDSTPTPPATPSGYKLAQTDFEQLTDAGKWKYTYVYRRRTNQEAVEMDGSELADCASDLADRQTITLIQDASVATATPPGTPSGLKLVEKSSRQIHGASTGEKWRNTYVYARQNREDEVEQGGTSYDADESALESKASVTVVEADGTPDGGVSVSGLVLRNVVKKQLHDSKWAITYQFGETSTEQDVEFPGTVTTTDAGNLLDEATITLVTDSGTYPTSMDTPPSGLKLRRIASRQLTDAGKWRHTAEYGLRDSTDDEEMGASSVTDDPSDLDDQQVIALVSDSGTPVAPDEAGGPSTPTGLKLREISTKQLHDGKWRHVYLFARTNREDDAEFRETLTILDAEALESGGTIGVINTSATPPSDPGAPATDTKLISTSTRQLHGAATPKYLHIFKYGVRTTQEDIEWLQAKAIAEAGHLDRRPITVEVTSSDTPGSGTNPDGTNLSLYRTVSHRVTDTQYVHVFEWAPLTATEAMDADHTLATVDPGTIPLGTKQTECVIDGNASAPAAPAVSGLVCFQQETRRVGKAKYRHVYHYRYRSTEDELIADKTRTMVDASSLTSEAVTADVWEVDGGEPSAPTLSGYVLRSHTDLETSNPDYRVRVYEWGLTTTAQDITLPRTTKLTTAAEPDKQTVTTIETCLDADTPATIAAAYVTAQSLRASATWADVKVTKRTGTQAIVEVDYEDDDKLVTTRGWRTTLDRVGARPFTGWGDPNAIVHVTKLPGQPSVAAFFSECVLEYQSVHRTEGVIALRRRIVTDPALLGDLFHESLQRKVNNAAFLGFPAHSLMYAGPDLRGWKVIAGQHVAVIDYLFNYDSLEHFNDRNIPFGSVTLPEGIFVSDVGYTTAIALLGPDADLIWPDQADFSVFTA